MTAPEKCETCKYFYLPNSCHRFPPIKNIFVCGDSFAVWPTIEREYDWCGEYVSKEADR